MATGESDYSKRRKERLAGTYRAGPAVGNFSDRTAGQASVRGVRRGHNDRRNVDKRWRRNSCVVGRLRGRAVIRPYIRRLGVRPLNGRRRNGLDLQYVRRRYGLLWLFLRERGRLRRGWHGRHQPFDLHELTAARSKLIPRRLRFHQLFALPGYGRRVNDAAV